MSTAAIECTEYVYGLKTCGDRAEWLIDTIEGDVSPRPVCGMHAMLYKKPDGWERSPLPVEEPS